MKVRVVQTVEVSDDYRRAIRQFYGDDGLATREEVKQWIVNYGSSMDNDLALIDDDLALIDDGDDDDEPEGEG